MVRKESQNLGFTQAGKDPQDVVYPQPLLKAGLILPLDGVAQSLFEVVQHSKCAQAHGQENLCWRLANSMQTQIWEP